MQKQEIESASSPDRSVFVLQHEHERAPGVDDVKLLGVFSTREMAERAIEQLRLQPGFRDVQEGFTLDEYRLDETQWREGFVTKRVDNCEQDH